MMADLGSMLLQSESLLLNLLQSQLVVPSHDSTMGAGRQLSRLFHRSTLCDSLLVQRWKKKKKKRRKVQM